MPAYPYDEENMRGGNSEELLKTCYELADELMGTYEPFGQASSTYEDTGYPEMTALGIRTFLSVPENIHMMRDIGEHTLKDIETLGRVAEFDKKCGTSKDEKTIKLWSRVISDIKATCERTYEAIMGGVNKYMKEAGNKGKDKKR